MRLKVEDLKEIAKLIDEGWSRYQLTNKYNYPNGAMYKQLGFKTLEKGLSYSYDIIVGFIFRRKNL